MKEKNWQAFLRLCSKLKSEEELDQFFQFFLTHEERSNLTTRFLLVKALLKGEKTQREIAKDLGVSIAKITRGSNALKMIDRTLIEFLRGNIDG